MKLFGATWPVPFSVTVTGGLTGGLLVFDGIKKTLFVWMIVLLLQAAYTGSEPFIEWLKRKRMR